MTEDCDNDRPRPKVIEASNVYVLPYKDTVYVWRAGDNPPFAKNWDSDADGNREYEIRHKHSRCRLRQPIDLIMTFVRAEGGHCVFGGTCVANTRISSD